MELLLDYVPAGGIAGRLRPGAHPGPRRRPGRDQPGVPRGVLGERGGRRPGARSTSAGPLSAAITEVRTSATDLDIPWWTITPFAVTESSVTADAPDSPQALAADEGEPAERPSFADRVPSRRRSYRGDTTHVLGGRAPLAVRPVAGRAGHRGPRARAAAGRAAPGRGRGRGRARFRGPGARARAGRGQRGHRAAGGRLRLAVGPAGRAGRDRHGGPAARAAGRTRRMPSRRRGGIDPLQLTPGDYIVHEQHGVGRYVEMTSRTVQGATRDYLVIEYAPSKRGQPAGPAVPAHRPARRGDQVLRRRGAGAAPAGRRRLGQGQGPGPQGGPRHRGRADPALPGPDGLARARVRARTRPGSASWRTPSPTSRRPTSWRRSTRSRPTWRSRSRWTG